jgi:hypothetical protein
MATERSQSVPTRQNGVTRPNAGTITGRVWELAHELQAALGKPPARREVIAKGVAEGINEATLSTQYGYWRRFHGVSGRARGTSPTPAPVSVAVAAQRVEQRPMTKLSNQVVGNVGLYYVCYRLSLAGWNVMPTARNARGIDIVLYSTTGKRFASIQVKALSNPAPVPLGSHLDHLFADHFVICRRVASERPECFVLTPAEVRERAHKGVKNGNETFWLQPKSYEEFRERWERIGSGLDG